MNFKMVSSLIAPFTSIWDFAKRRSDSSFCEADGRWSDVAGGCFGVTVDDEAGELDDRGEVGGSRGRWSGVLK